MISYLCSYDEKCHGRRHAAESLTESRPLADGLPVAVASASAAAAPTVTAATAAVAVTPAPASGCQPEAGASLRRRPSAG